MLDKGCWRVGRAGVTGAGRRRGAGGKVCACAKLATINTYAGTHVFEHICLAATFSVGCLVLRGVPEQLDMCSSMEETPFLLGNISLKICNGLCDYLRKDGCLAHGGQLQWA